jgi:hypothetical protein
MVRIPDLVLRPRAPNFLSVLFSFSFLEFWKVTQFLDGSIRSFPVPAENLRFTIRSLKRDRSRLNF